MIGVLANSGAVFILSLIGVYVGQRISDKVQTQVMTALALCASIMGIQMGMKADQFIVVILSVALGTGIGAALDIDGGLARFGEKIDKSTLLCRCHGHRRLSSGGRFRKQ
mgnify:CR=1 FL=1